VNSSLSHRKIHLGKKVFLGSIDSRREGQSLLGIRKPWDNSHGPFVVENGVQEKTTIDTPREEVERSKGNPGKTVTTIDRLMGLNGSTGGKKG